MYLAAAMRQQGHTDQKKFYAKFRSSLKKFLGIPKNIETETWERMMDSAVEFSERAFDRVIRKIDERNKEIGEEEIRLVRMK